MKKAIFQKLPPYRKKQVRLGCLGIFLSCLLFLTLDYWFYPWEMPQSPLSKNYPDNALWVQYTYYFGEKTDTQIQTLAKNMAERDIAQAYFHVRFIQRDGTLHFRYPDKAQHLLATLRKVNPNTKAIAWVYVGNKRGAGAVDLSKPEIRAKMVTEAKWLCETCGFEGIQWDYEICEDGNKDLLSLLSETRAALPQGKTLGVCTSLWLPISGIYGWSDVYIAQVATHVDTLSVMCYDTGFSLPRAYVWLTRQQVVHFTQSAARGNPKARVWIGVPTYEKGFFSHNPHAENITNALRGVREGLNLPQTSSANFGGVALFADHTTDDSKWEIYEKQWRRGFLANAALKEN